MNSTDGLPLHRIPEMNRQTMVARLEFERCVEVVQTQIGRNRDFVWARVIVPNVFYQSRGYKNRRHKFISGWIPLINAQTGSSWAAPVSLGAYVVVADEPGCIVTEGGQLDSKEKGTIAPGSCMEVIATRMEGGVVRGLIASGGYATLFAAAKRSNNRNTAGGDGDGDEQQQSMRAMPVPLGDYKIIQNAIRVTAEVESSSTLMKRLSLNATVTITEAHVEERSIDGSRVRGRLRAGGGADEADGGWITLFEVRRNRMKMYAHPKRSPGV